MSSTEEPVAEALAEAAMDDLGRGVSARAAEIGLLDADGPHQVLENRVDLVEVRIDRRALDGLQDRVDVLAPAADRRWRSAR